MKKLYILIVLGALTNLSSGQNFNEQFSKYFQENDTIGQKEVLQKWEKEDPENAELFTCYLNYYFSIARKEIVTLTTEQPEGEQLVLKDSIGKTAGYIGNQTTINPKILENGFEKIDKGIELYPNRLDMRFGKIYTLGQVKDWQRFTDEIIKTVRHSSDNKNQWTWSKGEKIDDGEDVLLSSIQDYQLNLYNTGDDALLENMRAIAQEILKFYPNHVESLSNLSITYLLTGQYDKGIKALKEAEKINPEDGIVLSNIAHGYTLKGDISNAIKYYEKMLELDDPQAKEFARQQIEALNSN